LHDSIKLSDLKNILQLIDYEYFGITKNIDYILLCETSIKLI